MGIKRYVGSREFYRKILAISIPIMIQNGITNFVSMLDNIMVGSLSTEAMSGVSIVNQFVFIYYLTIFGAISAVGIFTAQYCGANDAEGVRHTFRLKLYINLIGSLAGILLFAAMGDSLINLFLHTGSEQGDLALTLSLGKDYLKIMLIGLLPYAISQVYASTLREVGETVVPMVASLVAVGVNCGLNVVLIFGYLGLPAMGVKGAAIATVISRFAELAILLVWSHSRTEKYSFLKSAFRSFFVPAALIRAVAKKGLPLMANEIAWAVAITLRNQCYSIRGLDAVAAQNICSTLGNLLNVVYLSLGTAVGIVIGNLLGANKLDEARDEDRKMIAFAVTASTAVAILTIGASFVFPLAYNTTDSVRSLATYMLIITAITMPTQAFAHSSYFTLRSGGSVLVTILFDSGFMWAVVVPASVILAYLTSINIFVLFAVCQCLDSLKCIIAAYLLKKGTWVKRITIAK